MLSKRVLVCLYQHSFSIQSKLEQVKKILFRNKYVSSRRLDPRDYGPHAQ